MVGKATTKEEVAADIIRVITETGSTKLSDYLKHGKFCYDTIHNKFGCFWREALKQLNFNAVNSTRIDPQLLINDMLRVFHETGCTKQENYLKYGHYSKAVFRRIFGTWNNALRTLNLQVNMLKPGQYTDQDLIQAYWTLKDKIQHAPNAMEYRTLSGYSQGVIINVFGSYSNMMKVINDPDFTIDGASFSNEEIEQAAKDLYKQYGILTGHLLDQLLPVRGVTLRNRYGSIQKFCQHINIPLSSDTALTDLIYDSIRKNIKFPLEYEKKWTWFKSYRVDVYCDMLKLAIEIDGVGHDNQEDKMRDREKERILNKHGINVLRIKNYDIRYINPS